MNDEWNPRYKAYAAAHGRSPEDQLSHDEEMYKGGKMTGYMLWLRPHLRAFREAKGLTPDTVAWDMCISRHPNEFDRYLLSLP